MLARDRFSEGATISNKSCNKDARTMQSRTRARTSYTDRPCAALWPLLKSTGHSHICCNNQTRSEIVQCGVRGGERGGERGGDAPEPRPTQRAPRPQEIPRFRQRNEVELFIPNLHNKRLERAPSQRSKQGGRQPAHARWLPFLGYGRCGPRAPRNGM